MSHLSCGKSHVLLYTEDTIPLTSVMFTMKEAAKSFCCQRQAVAFDHYLYLLANFLLRTENAEISCPQGVLGEHTETIII